MILHDCTPILHNKREERTTEVNGKSNSTRFYTILLNSNVELENSNSTLELRRIA